MGSSQSSPQPSDSPLKNCLKIERIIASGCDYLPPNQMEYTIRVGILGSSDPMNPLSHQAIRLGSSEAYRLQSYQKTDDTLSYSFEKGVNLTLMKRRDSIVYNLKTPELDVTREIYPGIVTMFKPIELVSDELDTIGKFFQTR
jgi:hypothetical protein